MVNSELNPDEAQCLNRLDMMEQTIENNSKSIAPINKSSLEADDRRVSRITEFDLYEMDTFNNAPREKLGGMSLSMIYDNKLQGKIVQDMVQNSKTLQLLQKYNEGEVIEDKKSNKKEVNREFDASAKNQAQNKSIFLEKYGFETEIPTTYLMDAKIYPNDVRYAIKVIKYVIPDSTKEVCDLKDGKLTKTDFQTIYEDNKYSESNCVLQLVKIEVDKQRITTVREITVEDSTDIQISFSPDGKYFAFFKTTNNYLTIYTLDNIDELLDKVENHEFLRELPKVETLKDAQKLKFDQNNLYLISYGETCVNIIDLNDKEEQPFHVMIDQQKFDRIVDLQFVS